MKNKAAWRLHDGAEGEQCNPKWRGQRMQIRAIGSNHATIKKGHQIDWSQKFEWRFV